MSTAGKVLAVLVVLASLVWMILSAGVSQLNTNGNKKLHDLTEQIAKLQVDFKAAQDEIIALHDQTGSVQADFDRQITVLRLQQTDLEKAKSQIRETLSRNEYQIELVNQTIDRAKAAVQHRIEEQQADEEALAKSRSEVKDLMAKTTELANQLGVLRKDFQTKYHANVESIGATR